METLLWPVSGSVSGRRNTIANINAPITASSQKINVDDEDAVETVLADLRDAAGFDVLAQYHAEKRWFCRIFQGLFHEMSRGILRVDREMQQEILSGLPHGEQYGLLVRLRNLVDAAASQCCVKLGCERVHGKSV